MEMFLNRFVGWLNDDTERGTSICVILALVTLFYLIILVPVAWFEYNIALLSLGWQYWIAFGVLSLAIGEWCYIDYVKGYYGTEQRSYFYLMKIACLIFSAWFTYLALKIIRFIINSIPKVNWMNVAYWFGVVLLWILGIAAALAFIWFCILRPYFRLNILIAEKYDKITKPKRRGRPKGSKNKKNTR